MAATTVELPRRSWRTEGVVVRHQRRCPAVGGTDNPCSCRPSFQAQVWAVRDRKTIRKTFPTLGEAQAWREEARVGLRRGELQAPSPVIIGEAAEEWLERASAGLIRTRSGD